MSFVGRKPKSKQSTRKKLSFEEEEEDSEQEQIQSRKPKKTILKSSTSVTFDDDDIEKPLFKNKKMAPAPLNKDLLELTTPTMTSSTHYSTEALQELKKNQQVKNNVQKVEKIQVSTKNVQDEEDIADLQTILEAKRMREHKRLQLESGTSDRDFISLVHKGSKEKEKESKEARQDSGEEEAFEDYTQKQLLFGARAVEEAEKKKKVSFEQDFIQAQKEQDTKGEDQDMLDWEEELIRKGQGQSAKKVGKIKKIVYDYSIPSVGQTLSFEDQFTVIQNTVQGIEHTCLQETRDLVQTDLDINDAITCIETLNKQVTSTSAHYNYYQELKDFVENFADFLDEKERVFLTLEQEFFSYFEKRAQFEKQAVQMQVDSLASQISNWTVPDSIEMDQDLPDWDQLQSIKSDVQDEQLHFFDDVDEEYCSLVAIKQRFESWKFAYSSDYEKCYGTLSLPGLFELHVRQELLSWDPFHDSTNLENLQFHQLLIDYGNEPEPTLLIKLVTKYCIPKLKCLSSVYDVCQVQQTRHFMSLLNQFLDYTDAKSLVFTGLLDVISNRISETVQWLKERYNFTSVHFKATLDSQVLSARNDLISLLIDVFQSLLLWKRWLPKESIIQWTLVDIFTSILLPVFEGFPLVESAFTTIEQISQAIPDDWIEPGYTTSDLFKPFERLCTKYYTDTVSVGYSDRSIPDRLSQILVRINSLNLASKVSSRK